LNRFMPLDSSSWAVEPERAVHEPAPGSRTKENNGVKIRILTYLFCVGINYYTSLLQELGEGTSMV
jgi:hypothetical protein